MSFKKKPKSSKDLFGIQRDPCKGGFFFNFGFYKPTTNYFLEESEEPTSDGINFRLGTSFEAGNMFRLADLDNKAIGIRATWLNANQTNVEYDNEVVFSILHLSFLKLGPYFSFGLGDKMAIDAYYQIAPQYVIAYNIEGSDETLNFLGLTNSIGVAYRFSILATGFDANFGKAKYILQADDPETMEANIRFPYLRFYIGLKF